LKRLGQEAFVLAFGDKRDGGKMQQFNLAAISARVVDSSSQYIAKCRLEVERLSGRTFHWDEHGHVARCQFRKTGDFGQLNNMSC
jgi:hypothetical protein